MTSDTVATWRPLIEQVKSRILLSSVIGKTVRLTRKGRDFWGLCPFHHEKSSSFVVHDDKGFYHCFGCAAKGDVITFVAHTHHMSFKEALQMLAQEVGLELPDAPALNAQTAARSPLYPLLAQAHAWFQQHLMHSGGSAARDYLKSRGLTAAAVARFQIGWAPGGGETLLTALGGTQESQRYLKDVGLLRDKEGNRPHDWFRSRIIFPIHDDRGRVVAFGGRTLGDAQPKYLNSPETPLFSKQMHLYGWWPLQGEGGRALAAKPLVIVEGYLDVIALQMAGLGRAVAPLGTAFGEEQLRKAWRLSPSPILCFDGDEAGHKAALRSAEMAITLAKPGYSLSFVTLPRGSDPQSLVQEGQGPLLETLFQAPRPLVDVIWDHLKEGESLKTPESQASLKHKYQLLLERIASPEVREGYARTFNQRFFEDTRLQGGGRRIRAPLKVPTAPRATEVRVLQQKIIVLTLLNHPSLILEMAEDVLALAFDPGPLDDLRVALVHDCPLDPLTEIRNLRDLLTDASFLEVAQQLQESADLYAHAAFARKENPVDAVRAGLHDVIACFQRATGLHHDLEEARSHFARDMHEKAWVRLQRLKDFYDKSR